MAKTAAINQLDKNTVSMLDAAIKHIKNKIENGTGTRVNPEDQLSDSTVRKLRSMRRKYELQKGKTINLYNKHKKHPGLKGYSVSALSVEKIYQAIGKETKEGKIRSIGAWLKENPGNAVKLLGAGVATVGVLGQLGESGALAGIGEMLKEALFSSWQSTLITIGVAGLIGGFTWSAIKKKQYKDSLLKQEAEEAMQKDTGISIPQLGGEDGKPLTPEQINKLAEEASVDNNLIAYLEDTIRNPATKPTVARNAQAVLNRANQLEAQNLMRANAARLKTNIENAASRNPNENPEAKNLQNFAIYRELQDAIQIQDDNQVPNAKLNALMATIKTAPTSIVSGDDATLVTNGIKLKSGSSTEPDDAAKAAYKNLMADINALKWTDMSSSADAAAFVTTWTAGSGKTAYNAATKNANDSTKYENYLKGLITQKYNSEKAAAAKEDIKNTSGIDNEAAQEAYVTLVDSIATFPVDEIIKFNTVEKFETAIKAYPNYKTAIENGKGSEDTTIASHIKGLITQRFTQAKAIARIQNLQTQGYVTGLVSGANGTLSIDTTSSSTTKINGSELGSVESSGMEEILELAGISDPKTDTANKYKTLCAKYGGPGGVEAAVRAVAKNQVGLNNEVEMGS